MTCPSRHDDSDKTRVTFTWGPFLEGPEKFSHPKSHRIMSNLIITELFNSVIFFI